MAKGNRDITAILTAVLIAAIVPVLAYASEWTEEQARVDAFKDVQNKIDLTQYAATDPNHQENLAALRTLTNGQEHVFLKDRFVTINPAGYLVSQLNENRLPRDTLFYSPEGRLLEVRLFSAPSFPRAAYVYCYETYESDGKQYQPGELRRVSFHPSETEVFLFTPEGKLLMHDERGSSSQ